MQARGAAKSTGAIGRDGPDGSFTDKVMAKRKDIAGPRLEWVDLRRAGPSLKLPDPFKPETETATPPPPMRPDGER